LVRLESQGSREVSVAIASFRVKLLAALLPAMLLPLIASVVYFVLFSARSWAPLLYTATKIFTVAWPLFACSIILKEPFPRLAGDLGRRLRAGWFGALVGSAISGAMVGLLATPLGAVVLQSAGAIRVKAQQLGILDHYWSFALFLSLANSAVEEYYWRWFVYGKLRALVPGWGAHALAGAAFAAHHIVVATQFFPLAWGVFLGASVGVGGVIMSLLYERQGTLAGAWACHLVADLGIMGIGYWLLFAA